MLIINNHEISKLLNDHLWVIKNIAVDDDGSGGFATLEHPVFDEVCFAFDKSEEQTLDESFLAGFCDLLSENELYSEEVLRQIQTNTNDNSWFEHTCEVLDDLENFKNQNLQFVQELKQLN